MNVLSESKHSSVEMIAHVQLSAAPRQQRRRPAQLLLQGLGGVAAAVQVPLKCGDQVVQFWRARQVCTVSKQASANHDVSSRVTPTLGRQAHIAAASHATEIQLLPPHPCG
jgi:hypothetical protein